MSEIGKIILANDFEDLKKKLLNKYGKNLRIFEFDSFGLDETRSVISEAYIAENFLKIILIMTKRFNKESQNSLLKILEEPPKNIKFIIAVNSKSILLPTVCSRMIIENLITPKQRQKTDINLQKLDLKTLLKIINDKIKLENSDDFGKTDLMNFVENLILECFECGIKFSENELEIIRKILVNISLNAKSRATLTTLLLMIEGKR